MKTNLDCQPKDNEVIQLLADNLVPTLKITRKCPRSANLDWFCGWLLYSQISSLVSVIFND